MKAWIVAEIDDVARAIVDSEASDASFVLRRTLDRLKLGEIGIRDPVRRLCRAYGMGKNLSG